MGRKILQKKHFIEKNILSDHISWEEIFQVTTFNEKKYFK